MATPTAGKHAPTPPVSTPFSGPHLGFSPHGPRSVGPSPQQFKKSPANSNTVYGFPGGSGHPSGSSFGLGYDSPSAALALGGVPGLAELGLEGIGAPGLGALGSLGRGDEDEQKRKLQQVQDILKTNRGRLSEVGIERLARRVGLECLWEDQMGSGGSSRTLVIAGSALALDINFSNNIVKKVSLSFPGSPEIVAKHTDKAGEILSKDLQLAPGESLSTKMLDRFAANLERLAVLDKLSVIPDLNCHEAIAGLYESLEKLHKWEVMRLKEEDDMIGRDGEYIVRAATCLKSGTPVMHNRDRLGLGLDYWQDKRQISRRNTKQETHKTWCLLVECASSLGLVYTSLRVSEKWISDDVQKKNPPAEEIFLTVAGGPVLDWLQPESTLLPSSEASKPDSLGIISTETVQKYPEVIFVAKFDPPVIVPYNVAAQFHELVSTPMDVYQTSTFDGLMFPPRADEKLDPADARTMRRRTSVSTFKDGLKSTRLHNTTLTFEKVDYGRTLTELPFSHPRQLVEMLPTLRQFAFFSTILRKIQLGEENTENSKTNEEEPKMTKMGEFKGFITGTSLVDTQPLSIDISATTQPLPRLKVVFPFENRTANVTFDIRLNGAVEVISQNVIKGEWKGDGKPLAPADLGRILEITEDVGLWVEFIRGRLA